MKLFNFTIIKLSIFLITGILVGYFFKVSISLSATLSVSFLAILFLLLLIAKKKFTKTIWFGVVAFATIINIGVLTVSLHNEKNFKNHYTRYISSEKDSLKNITFRIREVLKPNVYYEKYVVDILKIDDKSTSGKLLLNIEKNPNSTILKVDNILVTKTNLQNLPTPLNPYQFDYKSFLEKKYIYRQIYTTNKLIYKVKNENRSIFGMAESIRDHINSKLNRYAFKPDELAITKALLLGQRQDISEEVYTNYTNAGAIHILAVSGLHIGIILLILSFVLKPLERIKHGKFIKTILLVFLLWSFAIIAGLSASVTRAVTMFSILTVALNLKRPTNVLNTLAISIFVLLLIKPLFLFDVGFQLSYLAVIAIVILDPLFYKLWQPKNYILDTFWHTLTVTISAQLGVIPISLYYFHNLPGLFFLSNLVIIPCLGIILGFGILVITLAVLNILPLSIAKLYGFNIDLMNSFVGWISQQEAFLFKNISFNLLYVFTSYLLLIALVSFWKQMNYKSLRFFLIAIAILQMVMIYNEFDKTTNQFIVFHKNRFTLIGNQTKNVFYTANDFDSLTQKKDQVATNYMLGNNLKFIQQNNLNSIYILNNKTLLVIDSLGIYNIKSISPGYVLLRQSPKINLNRLIDSIKPKYIIADGSNYKSYVENWKLICKKRKLPFHQTSKKGAFIIDY